MGYACMMLKLHELQACSQEHACIRTCWSNWRARSVSLGGAHWWGSEGGGQGKDQHLKDARDPYKPIPTLESCFFFFFVVSWLSVSTIAPNTRIIGLKILNCLEKLGKVCGPNQPVMVQSPLPRSPTRSWYHWTPCGWGQVLAHQLSPSSTTTD